MKQVLMFLAVAALLSAAAAQAESIVTAYTGPVAVSAEIDSTDVAYDVITIKITGINGSSTSTDEVYGLMGGQWSITGADNNTGFHILGSVDQTINTLGIVGIQPTYMNFENTTGNLFDDTTPSFATATGVSDVYSAFGNSWYGGAYLPVGKMLGVLEVTKGWTAITFGDCDENNPSMICISTLDPEYSYSIEPISIAITIPEPSSSAMLVAGLAAMLTCVWRKRR